MAAYLVQMKSGELLRIDLAEDAELAFEGDIARFNEGSRTVFAVHMRETVCIRALDAKVRPVPRDFED